MVDRRWREFAEQLLAGQTPKDVHRYPKNDMADNILAILKDPRALTTNLEQKAEWKVCASVVVCVSFVHLLTFSFTHADSVKHTHTLYTHWVAMTHTHRLTHTFTWISRHYWMTKTGLSMIKHVCLCFCVTVHCFVRFAWCHIEEPPPPFFSFIILVIPYLGCATILTSQAYRKIASSSMHWRCASMWFHIGCSSMRSCTNTCTRMYWCKS